MNSYREFLHRMTKDMTLPFYMVNSTLIGMVSLSLVVSTYQAKADQTSTSQPNMTLIKVNSCIQSVCGSTYPISSPENNPTVFWEGISPTEKEQKAFVNDSITRPIETYMGQLISREVQINKLFKDFPFDKLDINFSDSRRGLIYSFYTFNHIDEYIPAIYKNDKDAISFNQDILTKILKTKNPDWSDDQINLSISALISLEDAFNILYKVEFFLSQMSYDVLLSFFYPGIPLLEAQKLETEMIVAVYDLFQSYFPKMPLFYKESLVLKRSSNMEVLSDSEKLLMKKHIQTKFGLISLLQTKVQQAFIDAPIPDWRSFLISSHEAYKSSPTGKSILNPKTIKSTFQEGVEQCLSRLQNAYYSFPTQKQNKNFLELFETIKITAEELIQQKKNVNTQFLKDIRLQLPPAKEELISSWKGYLSESENQIRSSITELKKLNLEDQEDLESLYYILINNNLSRSLFSDVSSFCNQSRPQFLNDHALPVGRSIVLSWPTVVNPDYGLPIVAHELGHIVSEEIHDVLATEKKCLAEKQDTNQYLEEDFADLFSGELMKSLEKSKKYTTSKNMGCALIFPESIDAISNWPPAIYSTQNTTPTDTHSSGFYRLLALSQFSENLTSECKDYLVEAQETRFDSYCKWVGE